ncbi:MAG: DUF1957 domain-containing protein [Verrucomicrobiales bacterium]|nr:DUF1957 domain-containing protein [Verrucomicrobiales bacterium]
MISICRNALILHCHLPWLRHAESLHSQEEDWWLDVLTDSLLPLLEMLHRLRDEKVPFKLNLVISPTVLAMMRDPLLQKRAEAHLERNLHLALTEIERRTDPEKRPLLQWYADHYHRLHHYYQQRWQGDLVAALADLRDSGQLEIPASAATHAILPLFLKSPTVLHSQIKIGCDYYQECFGQAPELFWLPDCAYSPALDPYLQANGIRHILLDEHALSYSKQIPDAGIYHPTQSPTGMQISYRDVRSSRELLKLEAGLLHDTRYRQAYKMSGEETPVNGLQIHLDAKQHNRGGALKIQRMDSEQAYDPALGKKAAQQHAQQFLKARSQQATQLKAQGIQTPCILSIYEAELFGHWRFEGIPFLEETLRLFAQQNQLELSSVSQLSPPPSASITPVNTVHPIPCSWGEGDYFENWLSQENAWIYPHLLRRAEQLQRTLSALQQNIDGLPDQLADHRSRCVSQMTRELLLAQSSDWAAYMRQADTRPYATQRFEKHLENFDLLASLYSSNEQANTRQLLTIQKQNPIFPQLDWQAFTTTSNF